MFYDTYAYLCQQIGKSPSSVAQELGINKSNVTNWKNNGYTPRGDTLNRIAEYFNVSIDFLLRDGTPKAPATGGMAEAEAQSKISADDFTEQLMQSDISPDIVMIARAGKKMTADQAENLRKYAQYMFPEAFADDD